MPLPLPVYCEPGAMRTELRQLRDDGRITLYHFPYEQLSRGTREAPPSDATYDQIDVAYSTVRAHWQDFTPSTKLIDITSVIGSSNDVDILHVDSAYQAGCKCFLTRDRDILGPAHQLAQMLGMEFFHADHDWNLFLDSLSRWEDGDS